MIIEPSQWQIDQCTKYDKVVIMKKPLINKIFEFLIGYKPIFVNVNQKDSKGKIFKKSVDQRQVVIYSKDEVNSRITSEIECIKMGRNGSRFDWKREVAISSSVNDLTVFVDNNMYQFKVEDIEELFEKSKRKFNLSYHAVDTSSMDYEVIKVINVTEFDYNSLRYEFKNGFSLELVLFRLKDNDSNKDKFRILENLFKISVSGNDPVEMENKLYKLISDKINVMSSQSEDKVYESTLLENSYTEIIKECVEITKLTEN